MFCSKCGAEIKPGQKFCMKCGAPVAAGETQQAQKPTQKKPKMRNTEKNKPGQNNLKKKKIILAIVIAVVVVAVIAVIALKMLQVGNYAENNSDNDWVSVKEAGSDRDYVEDTSESEDTNDVYNEPDTQSAVNPDDNEDLDDDEDFEDENDDEYILPMSNQRVLTEDDLWDIKDDKDMIQLAVNEIYARHGRIFDDESIQNYFEQKSWYEGLYDSDEFDAGVFSKIELKNIDILVKYKNKLK